MKTTRYGAVSGRSRSGKLKRFLFNGISGRLMPFALLLAPFMLQFGAVATMGRSAFHSNDGVLTALLLSFYGAAVVGIVATTYSGWLYSERPRRTESIIPISYGAVSLICCALPIVFGSRIVG